MANPLHDSLVAPLALRTGPVLELADSAPLTGTALHAMTGRLVNALRGHGVRPGDRVAVKVEKSPQALALYLAVLSAGAVYLPLNTAYTAPEVAAFVADAEPVLFVADPADPVAHAAGMAVVTLAADGSGSLSEAAAAMPEAFVAAPREAGDLAAILYTSGTTGRSKGAMLSQDNLLSNARTLVDLWGFTAADVLLHALPMFHVHGLFVASNVALLAGARMIFLPRFEARQVADRLCAATVMMGVPTFYTRLLGLADFGRQTVRGVRLFVSGSAPLLPQTFAEFEARTGHRILERYGMTETGMNTSNPLKGERRPGTVGQALPGISVRAADPHSGMPVAAGEIGVLEVKGPNVFSGYWRRPDLNASEFRPDGHFITGDLGTVAADGTVTIVGRSKDLIISGGFNVYPKEVEEAIDAIGGVVESAVFAVPHPDFGEAVAAAVVITRDSTLTEEAVNLSLAGRLARFKQPKAVFLVSDLPRNTMGKVQKAVLRDRYRLTFQMN